MAYGNQGFTHRSLGQSTQHLRTPTCKLAHRIHAKNTDTPYQNTLQKKTTKGQTIARNVHNAKKSGRTRYMQGVERQRWQCAMEVHNLFGTLAGMRSHSHTLTHTSHHAKFKIQKRMAIIKKHLEWLSNSRSMLCGWVVAL